VEGNQGLTLLAVCTGNVCRSPAVQALLRTHLAAEDVVVSSAGTRALVGAPVAPPMADLVRAAGGETDGIRARQLTPAMVTGADLILTLTREHRSAVLTLEPRALRRTFSLREFAALLAYDAATGPAGDAPGGVTDRLRSCIGAAAAARALRRPGPGEDDIEDPYGRELSVYRSVAAEIASAVEAIARAVAPR
jgi:protein-tyrosine phosphatase